jgi:hypothetical protein
MYSSVKVEVVAADDSSLEQVLFERAASFYQTKDLESCSLTYRVGPSDAEAAVSIAPVTTGYRLVLLSDYPVLVRLNGVSETQFTLKSNNVPATNVGAPKPDQCFFAITGTVTALRLAPISGATETATVKVFCSGDPQSSYV